MTGGKMPLPTLRVPSSFYRGLTIALIPAAAFWAAIGWWLTQ